ncbi:MAG: alpha/beta fold hydrolase [Candidatus Hydrogenedentes bacterium]|nr:alpha/beta fold hydrolase [Candidatus Hydrogenedentota bacterium]
MLNHRGWEAILSSLQDGFYCVAVDLPGHGASVLTDREGAPKDFGGCADAVLGAADALGIDRFAVVGYSMGGRLALHLALSAPERITAAVLESASPGIKDESDRHARWVQDQRTARELESLAGDAAGLRNFLMHWYAQPIFQGLADKPALLEAAIAAQTAQDPIESAAALRLLSVAKQPSHWEAIGALACPALCIVGDQDRKYRMIAEEMSDLSPRIALGQFAACSHNVHLENPAGYTTALNLFLDSVCKHA